MRGTPDGRRPRPGYSESVDWKRTVNAALDRTTGYELRRRDRRAKPAARDRRDSASLRPGDRLVAAPTFILCTLRSGSTLLRVLLNSHPQVHAPHELHLRYVSVHLDRKWSKRSMNEMGLDARSLEYLLWDRVLHRELATSGKRLIVDKTPNNVFMANRLRECWPDARFVFLLRHPAAIARSWQDMAGKDGDKEIELIRRYCSALEGARQTYDGLTVRYEDLTADPLTTTRRLCRFLDIEWEPTMLEYGKFEHGRYRAGLGDFAEKIKMGEVRPPDPPPDEIPEPLREASAAWGYAPSVDSAASQRSATPS